MSELIEASEESEDILSNETAVNATEINYLACCWADFHLYIVSPTFSAISPPQLLEPEIINDDGDLEFVYPIYDHGYRLSTSKGTDLHSAGTSECKLHSTIEKMIQILVNKLSESETSPEVEVRVSFDGYISAERKAFESIINLSYNVVVTNFDPGPWGERYLDIVKRLADKGYGYPPESPRDSYRQSHRSIENQGSQRKG